MGETANGRTGKARIRAAGAMSLRRFMRPSETDWTNAVSPPRPFAVSLPDSWVLAPGSFPDERKLIPAITPTQAFPSFYAGFPGLALRRRERPERRACRRFHCC